jgi:hypothetical protein
MRRPFSDRARTIQAFHTIGALDRLEPVVLPIFPGTGVP